MPSLWQFVTTSPGNLPFLPGTTALDDSLPVFLPFQIVTKLFFHIPTSCLPSFFFFLNTYGFKRQNTEKGTNRKRERVSIHSPNAYSSQCWARLALGAQNSTWLCCVCGRTQLFSQMSPASKQCFNLMHHTIHSQFRFWRFLSKDGPVGDFQFAFAEGFYWTQFFACCCWIPMFLWVHPTPAWSRSEPPLPCLKVPNLTWWKTAWPLTRTLCFLACTSPRAFDAPLIWPNMMDSLCRSLFCKESKGERACVQPHPATCTRSHPSLYTTDTWPALVLPGV